MRGGRKLEATRPSDLTIRYVAVADPGDGPEYRRIYRANEWGGPIRERIVRGKPTRDGVEMLIVERRRALLMVEAMNRLSNG